MNEKKTAYRFQCPKCHIEYKTRSDARLCCYEDCPRCGNTVRKGRLHPGINTFRIQGEGIKGVPSYIPWWLAEEAYKYYSKKFGTQQSLERLNERGGFGREELLTLLRRGEFFK